MAPAATATQTVSTKIKRPIPPGIQTNGLNSSTSSPSPSMSTARLPSANSNGAASAVNGPRSANRNRRDAPTQLLGRGQRNSSVGLRSAGINGDSGAVQAVQPPPYVKTDEYILKKYRGNAPSLVVHLHPTHFRFDQQEGSFTYKSPMRIVIEHLRQRTIPHDLVEFLDVPFYEGCMIVEIHDHKSMAPSQDTNRSTNGAGKAIPFSVHNYNTFLTPSPYGPYPTSSPQLTQADGQSSEDNGDPKSKTAEQKDKENMPAPAIPVDNHYSKQQPRKPKISTIVLHPTPLSDHFSLMSKAADVAAHPEGRRDSRADGSMTVPPTPGSAIPSTPLAGMPPPPKRLKKNKADVDVAAVYGAAASVAVQTNSELILEPVSSARESAALLKALAHPMHADKPPSPKSRKRTVAEMAADEALAADQERFMLTMDERLSSNAAGVTGANPVDGDGQVGGGSFEPRFERFKALENIKADHLEKARIDRLRKEEADRKAAQDRERDKLKIEAEKREQEKNRSSQALQQQQQQQQQQAAARQLQQQQEAHRRAAMAAQAQQAQGMQGLPNQVQAQHAHPQANSMLPNGMQGQPQRFHQQVSQAQVSSPIVRNGTPQNHSSPMNMGNVPMQHSTSSMGGSPPRPGSVVHQNHPPMSAPTSHGMTSQRSQQSHAGTPRMPSSTPNIQNTPLNRQVSQTPRMSQASPLQGQIAQVPQVTMMPNGQPVQMTPQQMQQLQQHQQQQQQQRLHAAQVMQQNGQLMAGGMVNGQQLSPEQIMQARMLQQQQRQQQQQQGMGMSPMAQNYAAHMAAMTQSRGMQQNPSQNFINGNPNLPQQMTPQQQQQMLAFRAQQQAQQQQAQFQLQQQQLAQGQGQPSQQQLFQQQVMRLSQQIFQKDLPNFQARYPGGIPDEALNQLKAQSHQKATLQMQQQFRQQKMRVAQQQQMMAQQGAMQQNMNGMPHGMGM